MKVPFCIIVTKDKLKEIRLNILPFASEPLLPQRKVRGMRGGRQTKWLLIMETINNKVWGKGTTRDVTFSRYDLLSPILRAHILPHLNAG